MTFAFKNVERASQYSIPTNTFLQKVVHFVLKDLRPEYRRFHFKRYPIKKEIPLKNTRSRNLVIIDGELIQLTYYLKQIKCLLAENHEQGL
jgi:hypothetical protein